MSSPYFKAILKTETGRILEYGYAMGDVSAHTVDFFGHFVPLMRMGESAVIVRIADSVETHTFSGKVYLSSNQRLRLVEVANLVETDNPPFLTVNETMQAFVTAEDGSASDIEALLYAISLDTAKFSCLGSFAVGSTAILRGNGPIALHDIQIRIEKQLPLSGSVTCHLCTVLYMPEECRKAIADYAEKQGRFSF